jgi:hypothetical protein
VDHADWMNDAVRQEIEALQRTHGFEDDEAIAFWHLRGAGLLMSEMTQQGEQPPGWRTAAHNDDVAEWHTHIQHHVAALQRALAVRVLQRDYPDGWG